MKNEKVTILSSPSSVTGLWFIFASLLGIVWLLAAFLLSPFFGYIAMALVALAITLLVAGRIVQKKGVEVEEDEVIAIKFFNYFINLIIHGSQFVVLFPGAEKVLQSTKNTEEKISKKQTFTVTGPGTEDDSKAEKRPGDFKGAESTLEFGIKFQLRFDPDDVDDFICLSKSGGMKEIEKSVIRKIEERARQGYGDPLVGPRNLDEALASKDVDQLRWLNNFIPRHNEKLKKCSIPFDLLVQHFGLEGKIDSEHLPFAYRGNPEYKNGWSDVEKKAEAHFGSLEAATKAIEDRYKNLKKVLTNEGCKTDFGVLLCNMTFDVDASDEVKKATEKINKAEIKSQEELVNAERYLKRLNFYKREFIKAGHSEEEALKKAEEKIDQEEGFKKPIITVDINRPDGGKSDTGDALIASAGINNQGGDE